MFLFDDSRWQRLLRTSDAAQTPFFFYDLDIIREKWRSFAEYFPGFDVFFSLKANPNLEILKFLAACGSGADVSSAGELSRALSAGFANNRIIFTGPGKTRKELQIAVRRRIQHIVAESFREIEDIESICAEEPEPLQQSVLLRINPEPSACSEAFEMANILEPKPEHMSGPVKFGIEEHELRALPISLRYARLAGVQTYTSSQIFSVPELLANLDELIRLALAFRIRTAGQTLVLDWGIGLGIRQNAAHPALDLAGFRDGVARRVQQLRKHCEATLLAEVGRFLVAECGIFVSRVLRIKESRGKRFAILDGGIQHFLRPSIVRHKHPVCLLSDRDAPRTHTYALVGPACTPFDFFDQCAALPELHEGDLIAFGNAGAYGPSMSLVNFHCAGWPNEVVVDSNPASTSHTWRPSGSIA